MGEIMVDLHATGILFDSDRSHSFWGEGKFNRYAPIDNCVSMAFEKKLSKFADATRGSAAKTRSPGIYAADNANRQIEKT